MEYNNSAVFLLNPAVIMEELEEYYQNITFLPGSNRQTLEGIRFFSDFHHINQSYIYLIEINQIQDIKTFPAEGAYIVLGTLPEDVETGGASVIVIPKQSIGALQGSPTREESGVKTENPDPRAVFNHCLDIFQKHRSWSSGLQDIVLHRGTIDELCVLSYEYFGNPMFVHDPQLYILSCPIWKEGMVKWERDELTGAIAAPAELLNEFRLDSEYQDTLTTSKAEFFSADLRGHRDLYVNIRNEYGGYLGRLVIVELEQPIRESQKLSAEFLARLIRDVLLGYGNIQGIYGRAIDLLMERLLRGETCSEEEMEERLRLLGWHVKDSYICLALYSEANQDGNFSNISICNYLESAVPGSHAFLTDGQVGVLINRRLNPDYHSVMIEVLRDNLYMAGISNEFSDLLNIQLYFAQARIALTACMRRREIKWYTRFSAVAVDYMLGQAVKELPASCLCDPILPFLDAYDKKNGTELLKTLKTYILSERNTVQASKSLYIGRSTLFYRLRTITELTGLDGEGMAEPGRNLYLRMSFSLWDQRDTADASKTVPG
ncbi:MAG: helix-turn-helix domain-containing protein [Lachnospiraceae bacterium]|nr:helix-turn-helix domain-containing protein [Lachnospiraceae bacterium]